MHVDHSPHIVRFGTFELDLRAGELHKNGLKIHLAEQSIQILAMLLERPGEVVTREEIQAKLWPDDTIVEFDHSINAAVKRLRQALGDSADNPRYVETLARRGYRFIAPADVGAGLVPAQEGHPQGVPLQRHLWTLRLAGMAAVLLVGSAVGWFVWHRFEPRPTQPVPGTIRSLAVLPLENLSGDPQQEYFADGMTEALISEVGQIGSLRVISRTSVMQYKGTKKPLPQIARELNVDALVAGSVLRSGDRVRVTAQLIGAVPERHLWARSYDRDLRDVLTLQSEVARSIAEEVKAKVTPDVEARLARTRFVNPEAHEAYLKGRFFLSRLNREDLLKAIEYGEQAVRIDPNYAAAYGLLASAYWESSVIGFGDLPDREAAMKTRAAAVKALEIDDTLAEAHVGLGSVLDRNDWDWAGAEREFKRAIELNPSFGRAHAMYAFDLMLVGRGDESVREATRALELDPFSAHSHLAITEVLYHNMRQYDESLEHARKWIEMFPNSRGAYYWLGRNLEAKGMYGEAVAAWQKGMTLYGLSVKDAAALGRAYWAGGIGGVWRWQLERAKERSAREEVSPLVFATCYALLGEKEKAFEWLEKGFQQGDHGMAWVKVEPWFDSLRSDPRFQDLLRRMNFPP